MERSSPLAAMQPASLPFGQWGCRNDIPISYPNYGGRCREKNSFGPSSFNFKDLSMSKAPLDYFSLKPVRGSSPTTTLAADLSQNFHIDQRYVSQLHWMVLAFINFDNPSPGLPTPRRSLFSQNLFGTITGRGKPVTCTPTLETTAYNGIECVTTPPIPSSSPGPGNDLMDISPLPHKAPFVVAQIQLVPLSPEETPIEDLVSSLQDVNQEISKEAGRHPIFFE